MDKGIKSKITEFYFTKREINKNDIPDDVLFILKKLKKSGFLSFLVGGCIRDLLLGRLIRDWDVITDAQPEQIKVVFNEYKTILIGNSLRTVTLILNHNAYQISALKNKVQQNIINIQNNYSDILKEDLISRDFTINSMAWNQNIGLVDPVNGLTDLNNRVIRSIDPEIKFKKDPLRMLRAIRICCELDYCIYPETRDSIYKNVCLIKYVSPERIRDEIKFILNNQNANQGILLLYCLGFVHCILSLDGVKKIQIYKKGKKKIRLSGLDKLKQDLASQIALLGKIYYGSCKAARIFYLPIIKYLKFRRKIIETVKVLLSTEWEDLDFSSDINIRFILAEFGEENTKRVILLKQALLLEKGKIKQSKQMEIWKNLLKYELKKNYPLKLSDLAINGNDLHKIGIVEGKKIGEILNAALLKVIANPNYNNRDDLLRFVQGLIIKNNIKKTTTF